MTSHTRHACHAAAAVLAAVCLSGLSQAQTEVTAVLAGHARLPHDSTVAAPAEAGAVQPYSYTLLVWAAVLGALVFGDIPDHWTLAGAAIIITGAVAGVGASQVVISALIQTLIPAHSRRAAVWSGDKLMNGIQTGKLEEDAALSHDEVALGQAKERYESFMSEAETLAREKPRQALLTAFGVGLFVGLLLRR